MKIKICTKCKEEKSALEFYKSNSKCKICVKKQHKEYYYNNKTKTQAKQKEWAEKNKEKRKLQNRKYWLKLRKQVFDHYGNSCVCCGESISQFLTIDHVNGGGRTHRKKVGSAIYRWLRHNNYPSGFQTLCFNCNYGKYVNNGICPHKIKGK